jgi:hypothetical protein
MAKQVEHTALGQQHKVSLILPINPSLPTHTITLPRAALYSGSALPQPAADIALDVFDLRSIVTNLVDADCI